MRDEILSYLMCPVCQGKTFKINKLSEDGKEIREGRVVCDGCGAEFTVNKGILAIHQGLSKEAKAELQARAATVNKEDYREWRDEQWVLDYPDCKKLGSDASADRIIKLISENAYASIKKYITSKNLTILEIGAAHCWLTRKLAADNYCIAMDILTEKYEGLESADAYFKNSPIFFERVVADMIELPYREKSFDIVLISSSLHHSSDIGKTLREISRILKDDGKLVLFSEPYSGLIGSEGRKRVERENEEGFNEGRSTLQEWKHIFSSNGFKASIFLPENFFSVLDSRGGLFKLIGLILKKMPNSLAGLCMTISKPFIFILFDGYFNATAVKNVQG